MMNTTTKEELFREALRREGIAVGPVHRIARVAGPREGDASFAQRRIWIQQMLDPRSTSYNIVLALRIDGPLSAPAAEQALQTVVDRHEALRTSFRAARGQPLQVVQPRIPVRLSVVDLAEHGGDAALLDEVLAGRQRTVFALDRAPLFEFALARLSANASVLLVTLHHIIFDFVSSQVLFEEFGELYRGYARGVPCALPESRIQYLDYSEWQKREFDGAEAERRLRWWTETLGTGGDVAVPEVPGDRPWTPGTPFEPATVAFPLPHALVGRVRRLATDAGVSPFAVWLTAFHLLLHRYTDADDVLVCVPHSERGDADLERTIGFFVNFIVVPLHVRRAAGFAQAVRDVSAAYLEAAGDKAVPFDRLVEALSPSRHQGLSQLGEVGFGYQRTTRSRWELDGLSLSFLDVNVPIAKSELSLSVFESPGDSRAHIEYNGARFSAEMIRGMADRYVRLLSRLLDDPARPLGAVPAEAPASAEADALRAEDAEPATNLAALFERRAREQPDRTALVLDGVHLSYGALDRRANQVARMLMRDGVGIGSVVALLQPRGIDAYLNLLAIFKCGAVYVPLDPAHPPAYLARMLEVAEATHLIAERPEAVGDVVGVLPVRVLDAAALRASAGREDGRELKLPLAAELVAYVCFTSGSTGESKGVFVSHGAAAAHVQAFTRAVGIGAADRVLQFAAFGFDVSLEQVFSAWCAGAALVPRGETVWGVREFVEFLQAEQVSVANPPTAFWNQVARIGAGSGLSLPAGSLRCMIVGGEAMAAESAALWSRMSPPDVRLFNAYGPTEAVITATLHEVNPARDEGGASAPIGHPLPGHRAFAADRDGLPVPAGAVGELCLAGPCLAGGYLKHPRRTAERFQPLSTEEGGVAGARTYRSGDRVQVLMDGGFRYLQRQDDEVKVRGVRVNPGVIESVLLEDPRIIEGAVVMRDVRGFQYAGNGGPAPHDEAGWRALLARLPASVVEPSLAQAEEGEDDAPPADAAAPAAGDGRPGVIARQTPEFVLSLHVKQKDFLATPRAAQGNWVIDRALAECAEDLHAWNALARRFVAGSDRIEIAGDLATAQPAGGAGELLMNGQQVMQDWQAPLMRELARAVAEGHGDVLEIGFGMGMSAGYIQEHGVRTHVIIEANPGVAQAARRWRETHADRSIWIIQARWEDVIDELEQFDGILFDTYPMTEDEFRSHVIRDATFAQHFFPHAARRLRPGGVFTYYSNEIDSLSRRHQRALLREFSSLRVNVVRGLAPPPDSQNWWADSMAVVRASKE